MAQSPSHSLGQIIGYTMERAFFDMLQPIASEFSLYLDRQGPRASRGTRRKVTWVDDHENKHDLDFVLERGANEFTNGTPAAFIESAWRRYTKHSVNKAGEIASALEPLRRTYRFNRPFLGALVAGEWTRGGIAHLESRGICVLHLPLETLVDVFALKGVDMNYGESTPTDYLQKQVDLWDSLGPSGQADIAEALKENAAEQFEKFIIRLREHLSRRVQSVRILPLHGAPHVVTSVSEALSVLSALETQIPRPEELDFLRVEIQVRYSNTDVIEAQFTAVLEAILWLEQNYLDS